MTFVLLLTLALAGGERIHLPDEGVDLVSNLSRLYEWMGDHLVSRKQCPSGGGVMG